MTDDEVRYGRRVGDRKFGLLREVSLGNVISIMATMCSLGAVVLAVGKGWEGSQRDIAALKSNVMTLQTTFERHSTELKDQISDSGIRTRGDIDDLRRRVQDLDNRVARILDPRRGDIGRPAPLFGQAFRPPVAGHEARATELELTRRSEMP